MIGCRPLTDKEIDLLRTHFSEVIGDPVLDKFDLEKRNEALLFFGLYTGLRISEILSLKVRNVAPYGKVVSSLYIPRRAMKGKTEGRTIDLNGECAEMLTGYLTHYSRFDPDLPLFFSRKTNSSIQRRQAEHLFTKLFSTLAEKTKGDHFIGKLSCHTTRKTFASRCFAGLNRNVMDLQRALGHKSVSSTQSYISFDDELVRGVVGGLNFRGKKIGGGDK